MIEVLKDIGGFLGGHREIIDAERLRIFFEVAKVYVSDSALKQLLKKHVANSNNITLDEIDTICLLILKKPEFRGIFLQYATGYQSNETEDVMDYKEFKKFFKDQNGESITRSFFEELCS